MVEPMKPEPDASPDPVEATSDVLSHMTRPELEHRLRELEGELEETTRRAAKLARRQKQDASLCGVKQRQGKHAAEPT